MGVSIYDSVDDIINMLVDKWNYDGDTVPTPRITKIWEERSVGFVDDLQDTIVVTPDTEDIKYFSLYGTSHLHTTRVIIDIRSYDEERLKVIVDHVDKILKNQIRRENFVDLRVTVSRPLSQNYRNMFRHIFEVVYRKMNP